MKKRCIELFFLLVNVCMNMPHNPSTVLIHYYGIYVHIDILLYLLSCIHTRWLQLVIALFNALFCFHIFNVFYNIFSIHNYFYCGTHTETFLQNVKLICPFQC